MSVELISVLIAILTVGVALAGLILTGNRGLRQDMRQDMARLEHSQAKLEGLLEGLREAITVRATGS